MRCGIAAHPGQRITGKADGAVLQRRLTPQQWLPALVLAAAGCCTGCCSSFGGDACVRLRCQRRG